MTGLSRTGFVLIAFGGMNLCMKMETHYQKNCAKEQIKLQYQPEALTPFAYKNELSLEEKENILKDLYNSVLLFYRLVYEAKRIPDRTDKEH